jgi:hypothetical protein
LDFEARGGVSVVVQIDVPIFGTPVAVTNERDVAAGVVDVLPRAAVIPAVAWENVPVRIMGGGVTEEWAEVARLQGEWSCLATLRIADVISEAQPPQLRR